MLKYKEEQGKEEMETVGTEKGEKQKAEGESSGKRQLAYFKPSGKLI